jgi:uncharacterized protein (DUF736 family)
MMMAQIGTFTASATGGFSGTIHTLTLNAKIWIRPAEKENDRSPDYRIYAGRFECGAGWNKTSRGEREYVSVKLDDPGLAQPIYASLVTAENGEHRLIWSR